MTLLAKGYGKDLRMMRKESGLSQKQLADAIKTSDATVSSLETGIRNPSIDQLFDWAMACGFTARVFFSRRDQ